MIGRSVSVMFMIGGEILDTSVTGEAEFTVISRFISGPSTQSSV